MQLKQYFNCKKKCTVLNAHGRKEGLKAMRLDLKILGKKTTTETQTKQKNENNE